MISILTKSFHFFTLIQFVFLKIIFLQPRWINSMVKLTHLYIGNNKLSSFPDELGQLKSLEVLCAPCNFITDIPIVLSALKRLTQLNLSRNKLKKVPYGNYTNLLNN